MALSPFRFAYGTRQGRIQPSGWTPAAGSYVYCLGSDVEGSFVKLATGDLHQIEQTGDVTGVDLIRVSARLRGVEMPVGATWKLALLLNGNEVVARTLEAGRTVDRSDFAVDVSQFAGDQTIAIRLVLDGTLGEYEVELPGVYLDSVILEAASASPVVANRVPEPGETGVPSGSTIALDLIDTDGAGIGTATIYVDGIVAYSGGSPQPPFNGPDASSVGVGLGGNWVRVTLDPTTHFTTSQVVEVRVVATAVGGDDTLDTTYTFTVEDFAAPEVVEAYAVGETRVRVVFSEAMQLQDGSAALDPESYALSLESGAPAVTPGVVGVEADGAGAVVLTLADALTSWGLYRVTATGVLDMAGNAVVAPTNTATFQGWACPRPIGRDFEFWRWLPKINRAEDTNGELYAVVQCLQDIIDRLLCEIDRFVEILDPDLAPEEWLDLMLYDLGNPFPFVLDLQEKRRLVQALVGIYQMKGTDQGIIDAVAFFLQIPITIETMGWAPLGIGRARVGTSLRMGSSQLRTKLSFKIRVTQELTDEQRRRILAIANYMKDARTHVFKIAGPTPPVGPINHWAMGRSRIGVTTRLH